MGLRHTKHVNTDHNAGLLLVFKGTWTSETITIIPQRNFGYRQNMLDFEHSNL